MYKVLALISIILFIKIFIHRSIQPDLNKMSIEYAVLRNNLSIIDGSEQVKNYFLDVLQLENPDSFFGCNKKFTIEGKKYDFKGYVEDNICYVRMEKNIESHFLNQIPVGIQSIKNENCNSLFVTELSKRESTIVDLYQKDKKTFKKISNNNFHVLLPFLSIKEIDRLERSVQIFESLKKSKEMLCIISQEGEILFISKNLLDVTDGNAKYFSTLIFQIKNKLLFDESILVLENNIDKELIVSNWGGEKFKLRFYNCQEHYYLVLDPIGSLAHIINEKNNIEHTTKQMISKIDNPVIIGKEKVEFSNYPLVPKGQEFDVARKRITEMFKVETFSLLDGTTILLGTGMFDKYTNKLKSMIDDLVIHVQQNSLKNHLEFLLFDITNEFDLLSLERDNTSAIHLSVWKEFSSRINNFRKFATIKNLDTDIKPQISVPCTPYTLKVFVDFLLIECFRFQFKKKEIYIRSGKKTFFCLTIKKVTNTEKNDILFRLERFAKTNKIHFSQKMNDITIGLEFDNLN